MSKTRILITTTSFQDTPGRHHDLLPADQFEIERARGPLPEAEILRLVGAHDAIICGDDAFTKPVLQKCLPKLRVLSKYGIGVDKIDIPAATELKIPVTFCPGVNHVTVAEHTFGLLLSLTRLIPPQDALIKKGEWKRSTGRELAGKTMGILGLGRIGKEVAKRAKAFDMNVCAFDLYWDDAFAKQYGVERKPAGEDVLKTAEVVSLELTMSGSRIVDQRDSHFGARGWCACCPFGQTDSTIEQFACAFCSPTMTASTAPASPRWRQWPRGSARSTSSRRTSSSPRWGTRSRIHGPSRSSGRRSIIAMRIASTVRRLTASRLASHCSRASTSCSPESTSDRIWATRCGTRGRSPRRSRRRSSASVVSR